MEREPPLCIAIVICDMVIEDKRTHNKTLVNLFNSIITRQLPCTHPRMFIMASLTNGIGHWPITFCIRGPSGKEILRTQGDVNFSDPLEVVDVVVEVCWLPLEEEGTHFVDVLTDLTPLAERRFNVILREEDDS